MESSTNHQNLFAFNLFAEELKRNPGKNVILSPASIGIALAMTFNGAGGETRQAMARTLALPAGSSFKAVNRAYSEYCRSLLAADPKVELAIASALWAKQDVDFKKPFLARNRECYGARVTALDFGDPATLGLINGWVSEQTKGKIKGILDQISDEAILFLMNAIYFKAPWTVAFDPKATISDAEFTLFDGQNKRHPRMFQSGHYMYLKGAGFQAVALPYASKRFSLYLFLPDKGKGVKETQANQQRFLSGLNAPNWDSWMPQFRSTKGDVMVPRFKLEYDTELSGALSELGMGVAFDREHANFRSMCPVRPGENVCINQVKHKTFVEVNEEGTEAAAVTSVGMIRTTSVRLPEDSFTLNVDHAFVCAIVDEQSKSPLFLLSVIEPK